MPWIAARETSFRLKQHQDTRRHAQVIQGQNVLPGRQEQSRPDCTRADSYGLREKRLIKAAPLDLAPLT